MLLFSFVGLLLLRLDDDKLLELLFQLPPRITRDSPAPCPHRPSTHQALNTSQRKFQLCACSA